MTEKEHNFDEQALYDRIKESAKEIEAPESLSPENILKKCKETKQEKPAGKKFRFRNPRLVGGLSAAAVFIICCISLRGMGTGKFLKNSSPQADGAPAMDMCAGEASVEEYEEAAPTEEGTGAAENAIVRKNAGDLYTLAEDYDAVYEMLGAIKRARQRSDNGGSIKDFMNAAEGAGGATADMSAATSGIAVAETERKQASKEKAERYSETNVQTFGIDESDVVKTDGKYLYLLRGSSVTII